MNGKHLNEEQIQLYVLDRKNLSAERKDHIANCNLCRQKAEVYGALFTSIKNLPSSNFDFDLGASVMAALPQPVRRNLADKKLVWAIVICSIIIIAGGCLILNKFIPGVFSLSNINLVYLLLITIFIVFIFQVSDIFKNYHNKIKSLEFS
jgi:hypothetical protein